MAGGRLPPWSSLSWPTRITLIWLLLDAFTHLTMEALYCALTLAYGGARYAPAWLAGASYMWREYGKADSRWSAFDPTVLSLATTVGVLAAIVPAVREIEVLVAGRPSVENPSSGLSPRTAPTPTIVPVPTIKARFTVTPFS